MGERRKIGLNFFSEPSDCRAERAHHVGTETTEQVVHPVPHEAKLPYQLCSIMVKRLAI